MTVTAGPPQTREAILDAAEEVFGEGGYRSATMAAVADRAGVSRPLVHRYFGDKEALYRQVVERVLREWNDALLEVSARSAPTTGHALRAVMAECMAWARDRGMLRGILLRDADATRMIAKPTLDQGRRRLPDLLERVLAAGAARGDVRGDLAASDVAAVLAEVMIAGAIQALTATSEEGHQRRVEAMIEIALHGVIVTAPSP